MKKTMKCGIAAALVVAAGFAAYQTYGAYGAQDNTLLMQNIEALAGNADGDGDAGGDVSNQISNKAVEYVYGSEYKPTGLKAGVSASLNADLLSKLIEMIGKTKKGKTIDLNVRLYMDYTERPIYQKNCVDYPGSNCVCSSTNNGKWIYKPSPEPEWWGNEARKCK